MLDSITRGDRRELHSQYIAKRLEYFTHSSKDSATITQEASEIFDEKWSAVATRMEIVRGKSVLARLRSRVHDEYSVSLTDHRVISAFTRDEVPTDLAEMLQGLDKYRNS
jgi:hypothetical protein